MIQRIGVLLIVIGCSLTCHAQSAEWQPFDTQSADGTRIAYYVAGELLPDTSPLLVISGGPGSDHRYMRVGGSFERLAKKRAVIMFDQRGTSQSGSVEGAPRLDQWADDVEAIRSAVGASSLHLLGHSFGGIVAMNYAERYSDHLASLIFNNSTAPSIAETGNILREVFPDRIEEWQSTRARLPSTFKASEIAVFTSLEFVDLERLDVFLAAIADYTYNIDVNNALREDMAELDYTETLATLSIPALVLHGRYDPVITPLTAWNLHQLIPQSDLVILPATGHLPAAEVPDAYVEAVEGFLDGISLQVGGDSSSRVR